MDTPRKKFIGEVTEEVYEGVDNMQKCAEEILMFTRAGPPGASRLKQVLSSIFIYFQVERLDHREQILRACGMQPVQVDSGGDVTFFYRDYPCYNPYKQPSSKKGNLNFEGVENDEPIELADSEE
jgi:hypothetical protein